jgi:hypothetical protein
MPELTRRTFLSAGATLLAGFGVAAVLPDSADAATAPGSAGAGASGQPADLALYRPVTVSSTDYAPTPAEFAVDQIAQPGVGGTGWRAAAGDPQWIVVDLQAICSVESVGLVFEATLNDTAFNGDYTHTTGDEILSSAAVAFSVDISTDNKNWTSVYQTTAGTGGAMHIALPEPVAARWVRLTSTQRSNTNPLGLNGFQVYGTAAAGRPDATGWTANWGQDKPAPPALSVADDGTVPLESGWDLTMDNFAPTQDGTVLSSAGVDTSTWLPAVVPGTILATLVEQGHLPDPVAGFNNLHVPEALSRHNWWYRRAFALPRGLDTSSGRHVWLEFDGVNHAATIWLNGTSVGTQTHPFARGAYDVTAALANGRGQHVLAVRVSPPPHPGTPGDKSSNGNTFVQSAELYLDSPTYLASSGWDWMPAVRDRVAGVWNHVRLRSTGDAVIGDPRVVTTLPKRPDLSVAQVAITVPVSNAGTSPVSVMVQASFDRVTVTQTVTVAAGASTEVTFTPDRFSQLTLRNPQVWWPNGYGDAALYDLTLTVRVGGRLSDRRALRFGIRQFDYASDQPVIVSPPASPPLVFNNDAATQTVNFPAQQARYVRILASDRATQWGVSIWTLSVVNSANPGTDLALQKTATASSVDNDSDGPQNATDGNAGTRWSSAYEDNQWIQVDLGTSMAFDSVVIVWEQAYAEDFQVQVSDDGATWTSVASVSNLTPIGDTGPQTETFAAQTAQYLRIQCGQRVTQWGVSMWTLSVLNSANPDNDLALHKTATASSDDGGSDAALMAVDGNPRTRWSSAYQDNQWIQVDFGAPVKFDTVSIAWEQAYARNYVIQVSNDGSTWTNVKTVDNSVVQMTVSVNGVKVFCRGGNWGWDELLRRTQNGRLEANVRMHRDMNFTMIRNWIASSNREELYQFCDQYGILVWNDFWADSYFPDDIPGYVSLATDTIRRYRTHPSIVAWCGANEEVPPPHIDVQVKQAVANDDGEVIYISNSAGGIVSGHGPYHWIEPAQYFNVDTYDSGAFGFHTELGMPVVSVAETIQNLVGDQPGWPISEVWNYHDWSPTANQQASSYLAAIDDRLGDSSSLDEFSRKAQFVNYENHRAMFEAWNANLWNNGTGLLLWMSHPAWYSTVWQTYDYDLDVNGAYYGARKGCEAVHVQANMPTWDVVAVNHRPAALTAASVSATVYDLRGRQLGQTQQQAVNVGASSTATAFTVATPPSAPNLHLVRLELRDRRNQLLSQNTYWRYGTPSDLQALNALPRTSLALEATGRSGDSLAATITNRGATVAAMVRLALRDRSGQRVLPAQYSDNYLWLLPGERRAVQASAFQGTARGTSLRLSADAYNAKAVTAS